MKTMFTHFRYIREPLGGIKLADLRPIDIQKLYNSMEEREVSPGVVRYTHAVFSSALKQAVKWDMFHRNPASAVICREWGVKK